MVGRPVERRKLGRQKKEIEMYCYVGQKIGFGGKRWLQIGRGSYLMTCFDISSVATLDYRSRLTYIVSSYKVKPLYYF
jgi:hypothetical protein